MNKLVFLGPPGAGKGTFAEMLAGEFGLRHISTGDILRAEMKAGTPLGEVARESVVAGRLVADDVVAAIVANQLQNPEAKQRGFILDGFPRTVKQAELLAGSLAAGGLLLEAAVLFEADRELLLRRLTARRLCRACGKLFNLLYGPPRQEGVCDACGGDLYQRADDSLATATERLAVYDRETAPLIGHYESRHLLRRVDSGHSKAAVFAALRQELEL